jgi:hypothetical protein
MSEISLKGEISMTDNYYLDEPKQISTISKRSCFRLLKNVTGWVLLSCALYGLIVAEAFLVEAARVLLTEFAGHWLRAILVVVMIVLFALLAGAAVFRGITARRARSTGPSFIEYSAICLGISLIEVVLAVFTAGPVLIPF